jgi:opacity protein-like surface antigen
MMKKILTIACLAALAASGTAATTWAQPVNDKSINWEGDYDLIGGLFGFRTDFVAGRGCDDGFTRTDFDAVVYTGQGNCYVKGWLTKNPYDCRVIIHLGQAAFRGGKCHVTVYQNHIVNQ